MQNKTNIRVFSVSTSDAYGGAARAACRIHQGVRSLDVDSRMFVKYKGTDDANVHALFEYVPHNPVYKVLEWCVQKVKNKIQHALWKPYRTTKKKYFLSDLRGARINGALQSWDYDVLHLHWINNRFVHIKELTKLHKPIVWTLHDSWPFCGICHLPMDCTQYEEHCGYCPMLGSSEEQDLAYNVFEKKAEIYKNLDLHIVAPSRWLADCAKNSALLGRFPITVIPNCVDTEVYQPMDKNQAALQIGLNPDKKYLLFGAMHATKDPNKGFDLLLNALQQIDGAEVELIVYGTNEDLSKYNIPIPVHSLGYIQGDMQMALLYSLADVTIVPSRSENLSNTIMESMSCGTPVVAFDIGGNSDMIDHKQNGYLADAYDSEDFAKGIIWSFENNKDNKLGMNARQKVLRTYTSKIICNQYAELYKALCAQSSIK